MVSYKDRLEKAEDEIRELKKVISGLIPPDGPFGFDLNKWTVEFLDKSVIVRRKTEEE
ncbi:MAG: hypothetical protein PHI12_11080 [Dehalococcoidales bacterium]|nr:hypothetical protein [Dehalococcoidales bacterium]